MKNWKEGNIVVYWKLGSTIVVPTNAGWKKTGENVMGAGIALEMSKLIPDLPLQYGVHCQNKTPRIHLVQHRIICVPSKPLNPKAPHLSWQQDADPKTVKESLEWLENNADTFPDLVYVPIIGAGNGRLDKELVKDLMTRTLKNEKFVGVEW